MKRSDEMNRPPAVSEVSFEDRIAAHKAMGKGFEEKKKELDASAIALTGVKQRIDVMTPGRDRDALIRSYNQQVQDLNARGKQFAAEVGDYQKANLEIQKELVFRSAQASMPPAPGMVTGIPARGTADGASSGIPEVDEARSLLASGPLGVDDLPALPTEPVKISDPAGHSQLLLHHQRN